MSESNNSGDQNNPRAVVSEDNPFLAKQVSKPSEF